MILCQRCKYYFITWDRKAPYGCRAMGFKSREIPSDTVFKSSGKSCLKFEQKKMKRAKK